MSEECSSPFTESVPHLRELTSSFAESVKNYKYTNLHACMCMHWHVRTLSWLNLAEFNQRNHVRSAQRNWLHSSTAYVQRSAIGYIHQSCTFSAAQLSTFFTAQMSTFHRFYCTKNMDRLTSTIPHQIPTFKKGSHRELTLQEAACPQSPAELFEVRFRCKGNCTTVHCKCFKAKGECTLHCHDRNGGAQCINTGPSAAPSGTFNLEQNTRSAPPEPSHNLKSRQANI